MGISYMAGRGLWKKQVGCSTRQNSPALVLDSTVMQDPEEGVWMSCPEGKRAGELAPSLLYPDVA